MAGAACPIQMRMDIRAGYRCFGSGNIKVDDGEYGGYGNHNFEIGLLHRF